MKIEDDIRAISADAFVDEEQQVKLMLDALSLSSVQLNQIYDSAQKYTEQIRQSKKQGVESFIQEYSLSTEEGVAIMCLAEGLLRVPDAKTAKQLIEDKIKDKNWQQHVGKSDSIFVNASTWGLFLTGKIASLNDSAFNIAKLFSKLSEPIILSATRRAMQLISSTFIIGENISEGVRNAAQYETHGSRISYDVLGESSRYHKQADFYYHEYVNAINTIAKGAKITDMHRQSSISVKLSALHPRFELLQEDRVRNELFPIVKELTILCMQNNIAITFDAEEASRLGIYLQLVSMLIAAPRLRAFNGVGFVVQAYQKRAIKVIDYIIKLAATYSKRIPVRLVKGAYWDSEIKHGQENGLLDYAVYTCKEFTDVSYLLCAQKLLQYQDLIYPQFATHNAYTVAAIQVMGKDKEFEFQRLHGVGTQLHSILLKKGFASRIYAPVGTYKDLLSYLIRRLLENGANNSFTNMVHGKEITVQNLLQHPIITARNKLSTKQRLTKPTDIFGDTRINSQGYDVGVISHVDEIQGGIATYSKEYYQVSSLVKGVALEDNCLEIAVIKPANLQKIGTYRVASVEQIRASLDNAHAAYSTWSAVPIATKSSILNKFADLLEQHRQRFYSILIREGGKNIKDSIAEVREAIDFARYYAVNAQNLLSKPIELPGYTGESNKLGFRSKGVFVCISPWNFPLAIFCGQVLAALVTGNTVIAKPAELTPIVAYLATQLMYRAGIPDDALQLLLGNGRIIGEILLNDHRVSGVCFTGSTTVARNINRIIASREGAIASLIAETGGQNAMIVDSSARLEQVTDSVIVSAFGSAGQRSSALRVLYIQDEIYDPLVEMIIGAMQELKIGDCEDLSNDIGPVISQHAKKELEEHVKYMLDNGFKLVTHHAKGKLSMLPGHFFVPHIFKINHISDLKKENFGPILHLRKYKIEELDAIIDEVNSTGYGLTFGIQSRIAKRASYIAQKIRAGNIYTNRSIIGAQVESHPFGGLGLSGTGFKAGGPNYLLRFMTEQTVTINTTIIGGNIQLLSHAI